MTPTALSIISSTFPEYARAFELAHTEPERRFLKRRLAEVSA
jgi:predicted RNA polymerase sigma factor